VGGNGGGGCVGKGGFTGVLFGWLVGGKGGGAAVAIE